MKCNGAAALTAAIAVSASCSLSCTGASAHGFAGDRFFPATVLTDDPFVADEMSLPTFTRPPTASDGTREYDLDFDIAKRLTPNLGVTLGQSYNWVKTPGLPGVSGFGGLSTGIQYQLFIDGPHEFMGLAGLDIDWAHTGRVQALGADQHTTLSPGLLFGKGFGDLPDSMTWLKPFAVTTNFSVSFPTKSMDAGAPNPMLMNYGAAIEYSLEYLQHHVKDVGLKAPFDRMIPVVEMAFTTGLNRGAGGQTTGTIQPGIIWAGQHFQVAAEMIVPINSDSGHGIGGLVQLHFYLDDLFPKSLGRPIFGD